MEQVLERCAGLDAHKKTVTECVRVPGTREERGTRGGGCLPAECRVGLTSRHVTQS